MDKIKQIDVEKNDKNDPKRKLPENNKCQSVPKSEGNNGGCGRGRGNVPDQTNWSEQGRRYTNHKSQNDSGRGRGRGNVPDQNLGKGFLPRL